MIQPSLKAKSLIAKTNHKENEFVVAEKALQAIRKIYS